jgi:pyridoxamine 5'-phosphate oxidase
MSEMDIAGLREEYMRELLDEADVRDDPIAQFRAWFDEAVQAELPMVNAMTLATATPEGTPSARIVLLKGVEPGGFTFYTDYRSRKARELEASGRAALLFYWIELEREVRIEGRVERTSARESADYFATRPLGSRLAALASHQSRAIPCRAALEERYAEVEKSAGATPACPPTWGGYRVLPDVIEFWQGRPNRLHDRLVYRRSGARAWEIVRLSP